MKKIFGILLSFLIAVFLLNSCGSNKLPIDKVKKPEIKLTDTIEEINKDTHCKRLENEFYNQNSELRKSVTIDLARDIEGYVKEKVAPRVREGNKVYLLQVKSLKVEENIDFEVAGYEFEFTSVETDMSRRQGFNPVSFNLDIDDFEYNSRKSNVKSDFYDCFIPGDFIESKIYDNSGQNAYDILYQMKWNLSVRVKYKNIIDYQKKITCPQFLYSEWSQIERGIYFSCD